jgi:hypothetical protein
MHLMLIATATGVQTEKPAMPSLGGVMLSPRRLSRKSKTAQSRLNSGLSRREIALLVPAKLLVKNGAYRGQYRQTAGAVAPAKE